MSLPQSQSADPVPQVPPQLPAAEDDSSDDDLESVVSLNTAAEAGRATLWENTPLSNIVSHHALNPAFSFETERKEWKDVAEGDVLVRTWKGDYFDTHSFYWVVKKNLKSIWVQALDGDDAHYVGQRERVTETVAQRWSQYYFKGGHEAFMKRIVKIAAQL